MPIPPDVTKALKKPFGTLIPDAQVTKSRVASTLEGASKIVTVGDATTERLAGFGIIPDVAVVDGRERRSKRSLPDKYRAREMRCKNPAGEISRDAVEILKKALAGEPPVRVLVDGEEDLLALPIFVMAPDGSVVLYGQPLEGLVAVKITAAKRQEAKDLMERMGVR